MHRLLITNAVVYFYYTVYSVYTLDGLSVNYFYGSYSLLLATNYQSAHKPTYPTVAVKLCNYALKPNKRIILE